MQPNKHTDWVWLASAAGAALMAVGGHWSPWSNDWLFTIGLIMAVPLLVQWPKRVGLWK